MKMFLTRIGFGSKVIITGDKTQKDLPSSAASGLDVAMKVLKKVDGISFCELTSKDVVRHPLVQKIVQAYEEYEKKAVQKKTDRTVKSKTKDFDGYNKEKIMTLNFESEYEKELPFDAREVAEKVFTFTMDYLGCPYEAEVSLLLTDDETIHQINKEQRDIDRALMCCLFR